MQTNSYDWWNAQGDEISKRVFAAIGQIHESDSGRIQNNLRYLKLYTGKDNLQLQTTNHIQRVMQVRAAVKDFTKLQMNVIQSCIDTLHAKICKQKQRVRFLTDGGSWASQRKAMKADKFVFGTFHNLDVHNVNKKVTVDSYIWGSGFGHVYSKVKGKKVKLFCERVFPDEIVVDPEDGVDGNPRTLYRIKPVAADLLRKKYGSKVSAQIDMLSTDRSESGTFDSITQKILVAECWHLPDEDGEGGMHALCIDGATLHSEPWTRDKFPFAKQDYKWSPIGYFGQGVSDMLEGKQIDINRMLEYRRACLRRGANPRTYVERGSKVVDEELTNEINSIVHYSNTIPTQAVSPAYSGEVEGALQDTINKCFQECGISQLSAQSQKPAGLDSGKALREFSDIESERFQLAGQARQDWHVEVAHLLLEELAACKKKYGEDIEYEAMAYDKNSGFEKLSYSEFELQPNDYLIQSYPVSMFPKTPEGQLSFAQELAQSGLIEPEEALDLFDFPDTEKTTQRKISPLRLARQTVEKILDDAIYIGPEPYENVEKNYAVASEYYSQAKLLLIDEDRLDLLRKYMDDNMRLIIKKQQAQNPPQPTMVAPAQQLVQSQLAATPVAQAAPGQALANIY